MRDVWSGSIGVARLKALQATAAAPIEEAVVGLPPVRQETAAAARPMSVTSASEPYQPSYRALPASGMGSAEHGKAAESAADGGWLESGLTVAGTAYEMMPSVHTVASVVSIASTLGSTATGAAEITAGAVVGAAGTVATAALGAPGSVVTAVAGAAVTAAATASKVSLGAVNTAANIAIVGSKVAQLVPGPSTLVPSTSEVGAAADSASHEMDLPSVPGGPGALEVRCQPPPPVQQPTAVAAGGVASRLPSVTGAIQDMREMLPEMPAVLGSRPSSAYDEI